MQRAFCRRELQFIAVSHGTIRRVRSRHRGQRPSLVLVLKPIPITECTGVLNFLRNHINRKRRGDCIPSVTVREVRWPVWMQGLKTQLTTHAIGQEPRLVSHLHSAHVAGTFTGIGGPAQIYLLPSSTVIRWFCGDHQPPSHGGK